MFNNITQQVLKVKYLVKSIFQIDQISSIFTHLKWCVLAFMIIEKLDKVLNLFKFSTTWGCVPLLQSTTSSDWKLLILI